MDMFDMMLANKLAGGTSDYGDLTNKPQINGHTLSGNQTGGDLGLAQAQDVAPLLSHISFDSSSKHYYLQQTQPANPQDGDIWIG